MLSSYLLFILLFPLGGFLLNGLGHRYFSKTTSAWIACMAIFIPFILSLLAFKQIAIQEPTPQFDYFKFLSLSQLDISFSLTLNHLNGIYLLIITGIGLLIHIYSVGYMHEDKAFGKYFAYLNLFVFAMLLLVLGSNYLILFIGWEGVGVCSFLLIGFWNENKTYTYAARKAFIMNRIGDFCFLIAMFLLLTNFHTLDFALLQEQNFNSLSPTTINAIAILLFLGATGKSAQLPLYTWLPDAMAGPTPVSALIHAATMVTAGIFLISRTYFIFDLSPSIQTIILYTGIATALIGATTACVQTDIKKVLAYSTVSQLGFMFISLGVGNYEGAIFHVITHAFFKALLFLGAGSVIHAMNGEQDILKMGGLKGKIKITHFTFLIACLAIAGIPGLSGFFSKDNILMAVYQHNSTLYWVVLSIALLTAFYMFRLYFLTFHGTYRNTELQELHIHESPRSMTIPLLILAVLSIIGGYINIPHVLGGHETLRQFLTHQISLKEIHLSASLEWTLMAVTVLLVIGVILLSKKKYAKSDIAKETKNKGLLFFFEKKWFVDEVYQKIFVVRIEQIGQFFKTNIDTKIIDSGVENVGKAVLFASKKIRYLQGGKIGTYIFWMVLGIILFFIFLLQ